jgi:hypothetical protein
MSGKVEIQSAAELYNRIYSWPKFERQLLGAMLQMQLTLRKEAGAKTVHQIGEEYDLSAPAAEAAWRFVCHRMSTPAGELQA